MELQIQVPEFFDFLQGCVAAFNGTLTVDQHDVGLGGINYQVVLQAEKMKAGEDQLELGWSGTQEGHIICERQHEQLQGGLGVEVTVHGGENV